MRVAQSGGELGSGSHSTTARLPRGQGFEPPWLSPGKQAGEQLGAGGQGLSEPAQGTAKPGATRGDAHDYLPLTTAGSSAKSGRENEPSPLCQGTAVLSDSHVFMC